MAWGGERGIVVVDIWRRALVAALPAAALYHAAPAPPRHDRQRSPSLDQVRPAPTAPPPPQQGDA